MGMFSPFVGNVADRFGTARTVAAGGALYVIGMFMIAFASEGVVLTLGNVLCGIGMTAAGIGPIFGAISRHTPPEKRSIALGVTTTGGSFGQFAIVPFASLPQYRRHRAGHGCRLTCGEPMHLRTPRTPQRAAEGARATARRDCSIRPYSPF